MVLRHHKPRSLEHLNVQQTNIMSAGQNITLVGRQGQVRILHKIGVVAERLQGGKIGGNRIHDDGIQQHRLQANTSINRVNVQGRHQPGVIRHGGGRKLRGTRRERGGAVQDGGDGAQGRHAVGAVVLQIKPPAHTIEHAGRQPRLLLEHTIEIFSVLVLGTELPEHTAGTLVLHEGDSFRGQRL